MICFFFLLVYFFFFFSSRRRHTRSYGDWSSDVCSSDLGVLEIATNAFGRDVGAARAYFLWPVSLRVLLAAKNAVAYGFSAAIFRSEERRVGKECRSWGSACQ